jgi:hypothetical protein
MVVRGSRAPAAALTRRRAQSRSMHARRALWGRLSDFGCDWEILAAIERFWPRLSEQGFLRRIACWFCKLWFRSIYYLPALHPISLLCDYRDAVRKYADRNRVPNLLLLYWQLPTGVLLFSMNSEKMNFWFTTAAKAAGLQLLDKLTAHGHRSGSGTTVKKLGVDVAFFCQPSGFGCRMEDIL